jgi:hypothetical protein
MASIVGAVVREEKRMNGLSDAVSALARPSGLFEANSPLGEQSTVPGFPDSGAFSSTHSTRSQMKRTHDDVGVTETIKVPTSPGKGGIVLRMSPLDVVDGCVRGGVAWDSDKCVPAASSRMAELFAGPTRACHLDEEDKAAWQYITDGPRGVKTWTALEPLLKQYTRRQLGLMIFNSFETVRVWMVDEDDYGASSSSSSSGESEEASAESSEEVSYGPIDAWLGKTASK